MGEANGKAFSNLIDQFIEISDITISSGIRFIKTDTDSKEWLKGVVFQDLYNILPNARAITLKLNSEEYIAVVGLSINNYDINTDILESIDINSGLITFLLSENYIKLSSSIDYLAFYNEILFLSRAVEPEYSGHDLEDIISYLEPIQLYRIPSTSILYKNQTARVLCYIFSRDRKQLILNFSDELLDFISELTMVGSNAISFNLILNSLLSTNFKHSFLEVYRLVERLYPIG